MKLPKRTHLYCSLIPHLLCGSLISHLLCGVGLELYHWRYPGMLEEATKGRFRMQINVDVLCRNCAHKFAQQYSLSYGQNVIFRTI